VFACSKQVVNGDFIRLLNFFAKIIEI